MFSSAKGRGWAQGVRGLEEVARSEISREG